MPERLQPTVAALAFAIFVSFVSSAGAQEVGQLKPGARLRVTVDRPSAQVQIARFQALTDTTLVLSVDATSHTIPLTNITRLELSRGRRPSVVGGVVGLVLGAAIGGVVACDANRDSYGVFCGGQNDTKIAVGAGLGGVAGATLGAFLLRRELWRSVDLK